MSSKKSNEQGSRSFRFVDPNASTEKKWFKPDPKLSWRNTSLSMKRPRKWHQDSDVVVAFNSPELNTRLRRLMGSDVFRLNDKEYIDQLKKALAAQSKQEQEERIEKRERAELMRELRLISSGVQQGEVPKSLQKDPILRVQKRVAERLAKMNATLKTRREQNTERFMRHAKKIDGINEKAEQQRCVLAHDFRVKHLQRKELREHYMREEAEAGLDLLKIHSLDWRDCETDLYKFMQEQRRLLHEKSNKKPLLSSTDAKDMRVRAEKSYRAQLLQQQRARELKLLEMRERERERRKQIYVDATTRTSQMSHAQLKAIEAEENHKRRLREAHEFEENIKRQEQQLLKWDSATSYESLDPNNLRISYGYADDVATAKEELEQKMQESVKLGQVVDAPLYNRLRYQDQKLQQLAAAPNLTEMYLLADEIIRGEILEEAPLEEEFATVEEEATELEQDDSED